MIWKPTAICVDGDFLVYYTGKTEETLKAFPNISEEEALLLLDLLSKIFVYDPKDRTLAKELVAHPWFQQYARS
jgi:serine/threonine-protein kinase SRPK3